MADGKRKEEFTLMTLSKNVINRLFKISVGKLWITCEQKVPGVGGRKSSSPCDRRPGDRKSVV